MQESPYFVIILVDARHLDYTDTPSLLRSLVKHPSDGSKNSDVGHSWVYLQGIEDSQVVYVEGGQTAELGISQPRYFEGIMMKHEKGDSNPVEYLWCCQTDGCYQEGSGGHNPTYAAKMDLTKEQYELILAYMQTYVYREYYLTHHQCSSFVYEIAQIAGVDLEHQVVIDIQQNLNIYGQNIRLWEDPIYSQIAISSPDVVERSLVKAVENGKAEYALDWYLERHKVVWGDRWNNMYENVLFFPHRVQRVMLFRGIK